MNPFAHQRWERDTDAPCVQLGQPGDFDDMHLFAPCVALEDGQYRLWYCGSRGAVAQRVFRLGLATSDDGKTFAKHSPSPVLAMGDSRSILTPALLRGEDGLVLREDGRLRLWFAVTDFPSGDSRHTLHESRSADGIAWDEPSGPQLENLYAPSVLKLAGRYLLWYTDVSADPWCFRHATSADGRCWQVHPEPILTVDQPWEHQRLFYPTVVHSGGQFHLWYGSYSQLHPLMTALGYAVSDDGIHWRKAPNNPVFGPDPARPWESRFTTSECIVRLPDGTWRLWYASRSEQSQEHKYFAIGTAIWRGH